MEGRKVKTNTKKGGDSDVEPSSEDFQQKRRASTTTKLPKWVKSRYHRRRSAKSNDDAVPRRERRSLRRLSLAPVKAAMSRSALSGAIDTALETTEEDNNASLAPTSSKMVDRPPVLPKRRVSHCSTASSGSKNKDSSDRIYKRRESYNTASSGDSIKDALASFERIYGKKSDSYNSNTTTSSGSKKRRESSNSTVSSCGSRKYSFERTHKRRVSHDSKASSGSRKDSFDGMHRRRERCDSSSATSDGRLPPLIDFTFNDVFELSGDAGSNNSSKSASD